MYPGAEQRNKPGAPGDGLGMSTYFEIVLMMIVAQEFFSGAPQTAAQTRAPGFPTRFSSRMLTWTSGKNMKPKRQRTASKARSAKGRAPSSQARVSKFEIPLRAAFSRATSSI